MAEKRKPKLVHSRFLSVKYGFLALFALMGMAFVSDIMKLENTTLWFDLVKITGGYLLGNGAAIGLSR